MRDLAGWETRSAYVLGAICLYCLVGCVPVFSDLQDARVLGKGEVEFTSGLGTNHESSEGSTSSLQNVSFQLAVGTIEKVEWRLQYAHMFSSEGGGVNVLGGGPKLALLDQRVALYAPAGLLLGGGSGSGETVHLYPTILFTFPVSGSVDINPSLKALITYDSPGETAYAFNVGLGLHSKSLRFFLRPEVGLLWSPKENDHAWAVSVGTAFRSIRP